MTVFETENWSLLSLQVFASGESLLTIEERPCQNSAPGIVIRAPEALDRRDCVEAHLQINRYDAPQRIGMAVILFVALTLQYAMKLSRG